MPEVEYLIGVDMGGTNLRVHLFRAGRGGAGGVLEELHVVKRLLEADKGKTVSQGNFLVAITDVARYAKCSFDVRAINVGLALPGPMNIREGWVNCTNVPWGVFHVVREVKRRVAGVMNEYPRRKRVIPDDVHVRLDNDVNTQAMWMANLPENRRFRRMFLGNPGTGYGGGVCLRHSAREIVTAEEGVEVGFLNDYGLRYGFRNGRITADTRAAGEVFDERKVYSRLLKRGKDVYHRVEDFVCGRGLEMILSSFLGGASGEGARDEILSSADRPSAIVRCAHAGDGNCIRAIQIMGYHFGDSLYKADRLQKLDRIIWIGNTAEKEAAIMQPAVMEGYAKSFSRASKGREVISRKLDVVTDDRVRDNPEAYENPGAKGAALSVSSAAIRQESKRTLTDSRIICVDAGRLKAVLATSSSKTGMTASEEIDVRGVSYSGTCKKDWDAAGKRRLRTYGDFVDERSLPDDARLRAAGNAIADLMVWFYPDEERELVVTGVSRAEWDRMKKKVIDACCRGHFFSLPGRQFNKVRWVHNG